LEGPKIQDKTVKPGFKKVDKHPPTDEPPTGHSPEMSRKDVVC